MRVYYDRDCDINLIKDKKVAILGYGSQGHAHAQNLKDNGYKVVVGLYDGSKSKSKAVDDGFEVLSNSEATKRADLISFCLPDTVQGKVYKEEVLNEKNYSSKYLNMDFPLPFDFCAIAKAFGANGIFVFSLIWINSTDTIGGKLIGFLAKKGRLKAVIKIIIK